MDPAALRRLDDYWIHGRHPAGQLLAAEVWDVVKAECCVWSLETGELVWSLETGELVWRPEAASISWSADDAEGALLVGEYGDEFELPVVAGT